ncbi:MAG: hypothetical protein ACK5QT_11235 [Oligoflexia bacterium]
MFFCFMGDFQAHAEQSRLLVGGGTDSLSSLLVGKNKFDVSLGGYSIVARSARSSGSVAGVGLYQFNFRRAIFPKFEASIGYTIYFSQIITGDSGSGLDIGLNYYPFSSSAEVSASAGGQTLQIEEVFRPYVGATFNQRAYQSTQSSYSGLGVVVGAEHSLWRYVSVNGALRYVQLSGGGGVTATEISGFTGLSLRF